MIAELCKNLVSDKRSKTDIVLPMPTVHPVLFQKGLTYYLTASTRQSYILILTHP